VRIHRLTQSLPQCTQVSGAEMRKGLGASPRARVKRPDHRATQKWEIRINMG